MKYVRPFFFISLVICISSVALFAQSDASKSPKGFLRSWLLCGPFPNSVGSEEQMHQARVSHGLTSDYLIAVGGETAVQPKAGMKVGEQVEWFAYTSPDDLIMLDQIFKEKIPGCPATQMVAYAWTTFDSEYAGGAIVALGSDDGVRIWLNGTLVHDKQLLRWFVEDSDTVPVTVKKGVNTLLVKVDQGSGGWNFGLRIFDRQHCKVTVQENPVKECTELSILAPGDLAGKDITIHENKTKLLTIPLKKTPQGFAAGNCYIPFPKYPRTYGACTLTIDGALAGTIAMPDMNVSRAEAFIWQELRGYPPVFSGTSFPPIEFDKPDAMRKLIGSYSINTTFYDDEYTEVDKAVKTGRYGAVVRINASDGKTYRRFTTLYRLPNPVEWWNLDFKSDITLPAELGISTQAVSAHKELLSRFATGRIREGFTEDPSGAILLTGLREGQFDDLPDDFYNNPQQRDRRWWLKLKRKIYGWDKEYPGPFICPKPISGVPGSVVRPGSLEQAGMKPDFPEKLDALLQQWAADTDEAFAVCIVRRGIIAFHKAYGIRDGKPMTVNTPSWMASTSKMISGTCIMMLVDQGVIALDDPVQKFLPALRINPSKTPFTFRNLYTHTDGFEGHWGSWMNDMEERLAMKVPYYQVGTLYLYNGTGMDLGCKALEAVSGETLPDFYQHHLLKPLGCAHTFIGNACSDGRSIPLDMAKIGQMLLQKGVYGEKRFFSEKTFEQMLPRNLEYILGKKTPIEYGIGTTFHDSEGLGEGTFAHGAASSAATRIDPENDLVISMTRNTAGKNFGKYHPKFIQTIIEGIKKENPGE